MKSYRFTDDDRALVEKALVMAMQGVHEELDEAFTTNALFEPAQKVIEQVLNYVASLPNVYRISSPKAKTLLEKLT